MGRIFDWLIEQEKAGTGISEIRADCKKYLMKKTYAGEVTKREDTPYSWLKAAWKRGNGLCFWCKDDLPLKSATADHFIPLAKGGKHKRSNIVAACDGCNKAKGANDLNTQSKKTGETVSSMVERSGMMEDDEQRIEP